MLVPLLTVALAAAPVSTSAVSSSPALTPAQRSLQSLARVVASQVQSRRFRSKLASCRDANGVTSLILYTDARNMPRALYWTTTPTGTLTGGARWRFVYDEAGRLRYVQANSGSGNTTQTAEGFLNATGQDLGTGWPDGVPRPLQPQPLLSACQSGQRP